MISFASAVSTPKLFENYSVGDDTNADTYDTKSEAQLFTVGGVSEDKSIVVVNVSVKLFRLGTPGWIKVGVMENNASGYPDSSNVVTWGWLNADTITTNGAGAWYNVSMNESTDAILSYGTNYSLFINTSDGSTGVDEVSWMLDTDASGGGYPSGMRFASVDSQVSWEKQANNHDFMFELWGNESVVTWNYPTPANNTETAWVGTQDITFNVTVDNGANALVNMSLWINETLNQTIATADIVNTSLFIKNMSLGVWTYYINYCDGVTHLCSNSTPRTLLMSNWAEHKIYAPSTALVGNIENFGVELNLTVGTSITESNFVYDGVSYSTSVDSLGGDRYNITKDFNIPSGTGSKDFYFNFTLSTGEKANSSTNSITISSLALDDCSAYAFPLYNFTVFDEQTKDHLSTANATLNLQIFDENNQISVVNYSKDYGQAEYFRVCLQNELTSSSNYTIDLEMQYYNTSGGYAKEFYNIVNDRLTSADHGTNVSLYDLINTSSQEFEITYTDSSFLPVKDAVIQIQRRYVSEGVFRTVEQPKTDEYGKTLAHLEVNDVVYTFIAVVDGQVDATFNNVVAVCQNPTLNTCKISLNNLESFTNVVNFNTENGFSYNGPNFNRTTRELSMTFSVLSGTPEYVSLNVTFMDGLGTTDVCNHAITSSSGTLACTVPIAFGNSTVVATIYKSGSKVAELVVNLARDPAEIYGSSIVIIGLVMFITILGIGVSGNPMVTGAFLMLGSIALVILNVVYSTSFIGGAGATMLWFMVAIILVLIKGSNRV